MPLSRSLTTLIRALENNHTGVLIEKSGITITADLTKAHFAKISPLLYLLLNKFEIPYVILITGVPYCLMPDAAGRILYDKKPGAVYQHDSICRACRYGQICPGWMDGIKAAVRPPAVNDRPREIVFEVTKQCNLNCPICFSAKGSHELPLDTITRLIDECVRLGIKNVRFTGGEPLLYKPLGDALAYAKSKDRFITVNTNATLVTPVIEEALKQYADDVLISFQGFNPSTETQLTMCRTDFQKKLQTITRLNSSIPLVRLGTIISHTLISHFAKYFYVIGSLGLKHWELYRPMLQSPSENFDITPKDFLRLMKLIKIKRLQGYDITIANPIPFCITHDMGLSRHVLIGSEFDDGNSRLVVDARGFLKPSYLISKNLGQTIAEAWENPFLKKLRSLTYLPKECRGCGVLRWCKGGSRHMAYMAHHNYFGPDPFIKTGTGAVFHEK